MSDVTGEAKNAVAHGSGPRVMDSTQPAAHEATVADLRHATRELLASLLDALLTRLNLAAVELEMQLRMLLMMLLWAVCAIACAILGVALAVATLVVALWNTHRVLALLSASLVFAALA